MKIPASTYRLQMHHEFGFRNATEVVPYIASLGVSHIYLSPIQQARPKSRHGYDVCNHSRLNPELGSPEDFQIFVKAVQEHQLGIIVDIVPNHMCVAHASNHWWMDVLENGQSSRYAHYFDIDWNPLNTALDGKVLLPVLGDQYGKVLESGELKIEYDDGRFFLRYWENRFPLETKTTTSILQLHLNDLSEKLGSEHGEVLELKSILTAIRNLPPRTVQDAQLIDERYREKTIIQRRIRELLLASGDVRQHMEMSIADLNGQPKDAQSFDGLDAILELQAYRITHWQVSTEEINYRRFFDVNDLAAIRVEDEQVFQDTHELILKYIHDGIIDGLRVDHPDGLRDPCQYFTRLQLSAATPENPNSIYIVAEKILSEDEPLPSDWQVAGTTGYDFLNIVNSLQVQSESEAVFASVFTSCVGEHLPFSKLADESKYTIMIGGMASEIESLSLQLDRIAERNRYYRDYTLTSIRIAVRNVIAGLRVYRTYITPERPITERDADFLFQAVAEAKWRNRDTPAAVFDFVSDTIALRNLDTFQEQDQSLVVEWSARFQQLSGPIMAKGLEDTAFYIYNRFISLNEVGGHPYQFGISIDHFHEFHTHRSAEWPHTFSATSTHDTKRSEDVRARLNVLSEMPQIWAETIDRWRRRNAEFKTTIGNQVVPDPNDEYLLYQTLIGICSPLDIHADNAQDRVKTYMQKAIREAKTNTTWINPNLKYEESVDKFVEALFLHENAERFRLDLQMLIGQIAPFGYWNSILQTIMKLTCPGVPDCYQGTEMWDFSLVDPDNRREVDYAIRKATLNEVTGLDHFGSLQTRLEDGALKLAVSHRLLKDRRDHPEFYQFANYQPLVSTGSAAEHIVAFQRSWEKRQLIVIVPRFLHTLYGGEWKTIDSESLWNDTSIQLPTGTYRNLLTSETVEVTDNQVTLAAKIFHSFPMVVLQSQ